MSWFSSCSWCGGPFNRGNYRRCTNVSSGDEFVNPLEEGERCQWCTCKWCGYGLREGLCFFCPSRDGNSSIDVPNPNSFNDPPNVFTHPPQPQYESYSCELCGNDSHYGYDCPPRFPLYSIDHQEDLNQQRKSDVHDRRDKLNESHNELLNMMQSFCEMDPEDSLIMGDKDLSTIPEKESDEVIKSSVEDLVPIPSESEDTSKSDSECDLPSCDDFSPINIIEGNSVTFSNPLFDSNNDFTSSDDESLSDEDVPEDKVKIYLNPLFEFNDEYISSDTNHLFDEVLENIKNKDSYDSNLDEPNLLVTPFSDTNEDECFDPEGDIDEIDAFLEIDVSTDI
nr:hypothetical protein [Tanacetum cinerariifolium]